MKKIILLVGLVLTTHAWADQQPKDADAIREYIVKMPQKDLCLAYGHALRGEKIDDSKLKFKGAGQMVLDHAHKITLNMDDEAIKKKNVYLNMRVCNMYAAFGTPDNENRHVSSSGVSIQHVYGRTYIYTDNGVVTSWQD